MILRSGKGYAQRMGHRQDVSDRLITMHSVEIFRVVSRGSPMSLGNHDELCFASLSIYNRPTACTIIKVLDNVTETLRHVHAGRLCATSRDTPAADTVISPEPCPATRGLPIREFPQPLPDSANLPLVRLPDELGFTLHIQDPIAVPVVPAVHDQVRRVEVGAVPLRAQVGVVAPVEPRVVVPIDEGQPVCAEV